MKNSSWNQYFQIISRPLLFPSLLNLFSKWECKNKWSRQHRFQVALRFVNFQLCKKRHYSKKATGKLQFEKYKRNQIFHCLCFVQLEHDMNKLTDANMNNEQTDRCCCRRIVWVCLTILWGWRLKGQTCEYI